MKSIIVQKEEEILTNGCFLAFYLWDWLDKYCSGLEDWRKQVFGQY